ncbi:hypothetical protein PYH72_09990 [Staphylococcus delphini]|uniref:TscA family type II toxin-antitoxin system antitoxin n=1 Tax=Staphylococcus delphini TaxID=53344 RepID=UPI003364B526
MEFIGFADAQEFIKISGISEWHLEHEVYANAEFRKTCMFRFGKGGKRYIEIEHTYEVDREQHLESMIEWAIDQIEQHFDLDEEE